MLLSGRMLKNIEKRKESYYGKAAREDEKGHGTEELQPQDDYDLPVMDEEICDLPWENA
jgi:hypothetical protein